MRRMVEQGTPILAGSMEVAGTRDDPIYYNSSFLFLPGGGRPQKYRKRHLVPFGEYLPFDKRFRFIRDLAPLGYSCTPGESCGLFRLPLTAAQSGTLTNSPASPVGHSSLHEGTNGATFAALICFEDIMPYLARDAVRKGAGFLINQTNDAWFDGSSAALQHMSHCVFRCVENRVAAVRSANTGVTCFIEKTGRIQDVQTLSEYEWLTETSRFVRSEVALRTADESLTFYCRYGDIPFALPCAFAATFAFVLAALAGKQEDRDRMSQIIGGDRA